VLGTTISPYLLFWQSAHRIEDLRDEDLGGERPVPLGERRPGNARRRLTAAAGWTSWSGWPSATSSCSRS
jgi:hypothetical protein